MKIPILIFLSLSFITFSTYAHEGKKHEKTKQDTTIIQTDSLKQMDDLRDHDQMSDEQMVKYEIKIPDMIFEHTHNKIVHFTVALSLVTFLFTLLNFKWKQFDWTIKILVLISAIAGVIAYFTGTSQATMFEGESVEWVVEVHRTYGIISAIALWLWMIFLFVNPLKKYAWIIGTIIFILVSITGFYGGIIATS
jgi:uncharacterized membrane protein